MPASLDAAYRLTLFGSPVLTSQDGEVALAPQALLVLALVYGSEARRVSRSQAVVLLWGEQNPRTFHRLSQLVYSVNRKTVRPLIVGEGRFLRVAELGAKCDVWDFQRLCEVGDLEGALAIFSRGFLADVEAVPSRSFEEWIDERSGDFAARLRAAAEEAWRVAERDGSWHRAREAASVGFALRPWDEGWVERLMTAAALSEGVESALSVCARYAEWLRESVEDAAAPSAKILALAERLRNGVSVGASGGGGENWKEPRLCGRESEVRALREVLASPAPGRMTFVIVQGEGGIGKTRLITECLREVRVRGGLVLFSQAAELERELPLNVLLDAMSSREVSERLLSLADPWRSALLALLPELNSTPVESSTVPSAQEGALQRRLLEALRQLLISLAAEQQVVLFLDDFHWADDTSLAALEYVRRRWHGGWFVVVCGVRPEEVQRESKIGHFIRGLQEAEGHLVLELDELAEEDARDLIETVAGGRLAAEECGRIYALAGGNPFFLIELTLEEMGDGEVRDVTADAYAGGSAALPLSVTQLVQRRIERLSPNAFRLLGALCVWGKGGSLREVGWVSGVARERLLETVEELEAARLVRWSSGSLATRHELVRQAAYRSLGEGKCAWLHKRVADYLLRHRSPVPVDELALHCDRAGDHVRALTYSLEAAERAEAAGAVSEAVHFLSIALRSTADEGRRAEIIGRLAKLHYLQLDFASAGPLLDLAVQRYRSQGRTREALMAEVWRADVLHRVSAVPVSEVMQQLARIKSEGRREGYWEAVARSLDGSCPDPS